MGTDKSRYRFKSTGIVAEFPYSLLRQHWRQVPLYPKQMWSILPNQLLWKYHVLPPKGKWHPEWQRENPRVLVLARAAKSPNDRGFPPCRKCKTQQLQKFVLHLGGFPHTHTLQSSFSPPLPSVIAILFIKNSHLIPWEVFSAIFPNAKSHKSEP